MRTRRSLLVEKGNAPLAKPPAARYFGHLVDRLGDSTFKIDQGGVERPSSCGPYPPSQLPHIKKPETLDLITWKSSSPHHKP
jgi:hypothetical protein